MAHILLVSTDPDTSAPIVGLLRASGHRVVFAHDFHAGVAAMTEYPPDLLIADVRLGAFNGLHLAVRCHDVSPDTSVMLLDAVDDPITRTDARNLRAVYLARPLDDADLLAHVSRAAVQRQAPHRRWPRKHPAVGLAAQVAHRPARMLDLSYGGFRIEVPGLEAIQACFEVALPNFGVAVRAKSVWTRRAGSGSFWCGAELADSDAQSTVAWRHIVDAIAAQA